METPREPVSRDSSLSPDCFSPRSRHTGAYSEGLNEKEHLYQPCHEAPSPSSATPVVPEESLAASSSRSSRRSNSNSSNSSHADEEEEENSERRSVSTPNVSAPSSEGNCEVFYPAASHATDAARHYPEEAAGEQNLEGRQQASILQDSGVLSEHVHHHSYSKRADATEDEEGRRNGRYSSPEEPPPLEENPIIQPLNAERRLRGGARYDERDVLHTCSPSAECEASSAAWVPGTASSRYFVSRTSHTDMREGSRPCPVDTNGASCDVRCDGPPADASSTGLDAHSATCDAAEHSIYLKSYAFNQDSTCFLCATTAGFRVYTCAPLFEFMRRESTSWSEGCYEVAGMLFRTNLFALVSAAEQKKVKLWDDQKQTFIGELRSRQPIKNVCLGREVLAVVTEYTVYVYQSEQMRPFSIIHTGPNPRGLCIITSTQDADGWILACPAVAAGAVRVQTPDRDRASHVFQAHQTPLAVMAFNSRGTWIATASETGTVIRVFCALDGQLLHELRRGTHSYAVSCLALRADNLFLAVASSSPTVHIFKLELHELTEQKDCSEPRYLGNAGGGVDTAFVDRGSRDVQDPTGINPEAQHFYRCESVSSAATTLSTASCVEGGSSATGTNIPKAPAATVPLQQALSAGKELTSVVYDASKEIVNDVIKGVFFKYFSAVRSFAQFHVPIDQQAIDVRSPTSNILGPLCAFAGEISNHLYLLHPNGVFYEFRFDPNYGDECTLLTATPWFAPRPDFQIQVIDLRTTTYNRHTHAA